MMKVEEVLRKLRSRGGRITPQRRAVVGLLAGAGRAQSVPELHSALRQTFPDMSADTVYRIAECLVEIGAVEVFHDPSQRADRYEWVDRRHHHFVCLNCGEVVCLPECPVDKAAESMQLPEGFTVVRHEYQAFGYCKTCQGARSGSKVTDSAEGGDVQERPSSLKSEAAGPKSRRAARKAPGVERSDVRRSSVQQNGLQCDGAR